MDPFLEGNKTNVDRVISLEIVLVPLRFFLFVCLFVFLLLLLFLFCFVLFWLLGGGGGGGGARGRINNLQSSTSFDTHFVWMNFNHSTILHVVWLLFYELPVKSY